VGRPAADGFSVPLLSAFLSAFVVDVVVVVALVAWIPPDDDLNPFLLGRHFLKLTMLCLVALPPATRCLMLCWILVVEPFASRTVCTKKQKQQKKLETNLKNKKEKTLSMASYQQVLSGIDTGLLGGCDNLPCQPTCDIVSIYTYRTAFRHASGGCTQRAHSHDARTSCYGRNKWEQQSFQNRKAKERKIIEKMFSTSVVARQITATFRPFNNIAALSVFTFSRFYKYINRLLLSKIK
jgi:hypothetical protein